MEKNKELIKSNIKLKTILKNQLLKQQMLQQELIELKLTCFIFTFLLEKMMVDHTKDLQELYSGLDRLKMGKV